MTHDLDTMSDRLVEAVDAATLGLDLDEAAALLDRVIVSLGARADAIGHDRRKRGDDARRHASNNAPTDTTGDAR